MSTRRQSDGPAGQASGGLITLEAGSRARRFLLTMNEKGIANRRFSVLVGPENSVGRVKPPMTGPHRLAETSEASTFATRPRLEARTGVVAPEVSGQTLKSPRPRSIFCTPSHEPEPCAVNRVTQVSRTESPLVSTLAR